MENPCPHLLKVPGKNERIHTRLTLAKQEEEMKQVPKEIDPVVTERILNQFNEE